MPDRLVDTYPIGSRVLITFGNSGRWLPGVVIKHDHPGVWVVMPSNGEQWFVTHPDRIRLADVV